MNRQESDPMSSAAAAIPITQSPGLLAQLFANNYRRVLIAAYRITGNLPDAEDVTQTVFLRLGSGESLPMTNAGSYLYRAAINGALDLLRRRKSAALESIDAAASVPTTATAASPEAQSSGRELGHRLRQAISELSPRAAEMFALRYLEDMNNREIAELMNTSQAVVAVTLHQSRSRLKTRLKELERSIR
jgi:RNA polymerase sigma-70 factor (ECF subfamily)